MPLNRAALRWAPLLLVGIGALAAGCYSAEQYPFTTTETSTDFGRAILALYARVTWIVSVVWVVVFALLGYVLFRFRDDGSAGNPEQIHGNLQLEIGWTLVPIVLVLVMIVPTIRTIFQIADTAPEGALEVRVVGKRWWWAFEYVESGVVTANELHLPAGRPVSLLLESDTVIHSFWAPRLGGKRDAVPGRINRIWFTIDAEEATDGAELFRGECAEYCGESHALMRFDVFAHAPAEFDAWLSGMKNPAPLPADPLVQAGAAAFTSGGCVACHAVTGNAEATGKIGPNLTGFGNRRTLAAGTVDNTAEHLAQWLHDPNAIKPGTEGRFDGMNIPVELSQDQISALVAYLHALK